MLVKRWAHSNAGKMNPITKHSAYAESKQEGTMRARKTIVSNFFTLSVISN